MIVVTGGAGFIGSAFISKLNAQGVRDIIVVDEMGSSLRWKNLLGKSFVEYVHKNYFLEQVRSAALPKAITAIIHLGACSSTTETDVEFLMENNYRYSIALAEYAAARDIHFIYASSAATYGDGAQGYSDESELISLRPLNAYGYSKYLFDLHMLRMGFPKSVGLKFFNVFGPNEYHKADMRSMVVKAHQQIKANGSVKLFKSARSDYKDGEQKRDFIYVKDCSDVLWWLLQNPAVTGIYNLGSGKARTWNDLVRSVFSALKLAPSIQYIDMPDEVKNQYQYFTEATMQKLKATGCPLPKHSLEDSIEDYVRNFLEASNKIL